MDRDIVLIFFYGLIEGDKIIEAFSDECKLAQDAFLALADD